MLTKTVTGETVAVTEKPASRSETSVSRSVETASRPDESLSFDLSSQPDLAQTLAVTCAMLGRDGRSCKPDTAPRIATYDDHRMALAFAPCAWRFPGLAVQAPDVVSKSYPGYWREWEQLGAQVERVGKGGVA